ncbi:MAG: uncharacterized protein HW380_2302 [Magnetococcales bacterium]|nr:uncharacterized protein [Magnetococcales bacterium]HIJ83342.1 hypothetical protein [Magnetococcales bacterium]
MKTVSKFSLFFVGSVLSCAAWADGTLTAAHGGRMVEAAGHRLELVTMEDRVDLYLTDHGDQPVAAEKTKGKVTLLLTTGKVEIPLTPSGGNLLSGAGKAAGGKDVAAVVVVEGLNKPVIARLPAVPQGK